MWLCTDHKITGKVLLDLNIIILKEIGIEALDTQVRIDNAIDELRQKGVYSILNVFLLSDFPESVAQPSTPCKSQWPHYLLLNRVPLSRSSVSISKQRKRASSLSLLSGDEGPHRKRTRKHS